jgi:hypothetical protein
MLNRNKDVSLRSTRFLWKSYTPNMYYWEVVECIRRLLLTGAVVFIAPGTSAQAAIACVFAVFSIVVALYCQPHADIRDGQIYTVGTVIIFLSMFLSLAMKSDVSNETDHSQKAFGIVLVVLNVFMAAAAVAQLALVGRRAYASRQNSVLGLGRVDYDSDNDNIDNDGNAVDIEPSLAAATARTTATAAAVAPDEYEIVEHGVVATTTNNNNINNKNKREGNPKF